MDLVALTSVLTVVLPAVTALVGTLVANVSLGRRHTLDLMRLQILSPELPPNIRLEVYDAYKKLGGNSWLDSYVNTVLKPKVIHELAQKDGEK